MNLRYPTALSQTARQEIARDLIALGGLPFYLLVVARSTVGSYYSFLCQVAIALPVLFLLSRVVRGSNPHIARALILVVFTSLFYRALPFTIFAALVWGCMIFSLMYLKVSTGEILKGIALGAASAAVSYALTLLIVPG